MSKEMDVPHPPEGKDIDELLNLNIDSTFDEFVAALDKQAPPLPLGAESAEIDEQLKEFKRVNNIVLIKTEPKRHRAGLRVLLVAAIVLALVALVAGAAIQSFYKFTVNGDTVLITPSAQSGKIAFDEKSIDTPYRSLAEALAENNMPAIEPTWIPAPLSLIWVKSSSVDDTLTVSAWYAESADDEKGFSIRVTDYRNAPNIAEILEIEKKSGTAETINNIEYFIAQNGSRYKAVWSTAPYLCVISGQLTKEELLQTISSISKG